MLSTRAVMRNILRKFNFVMLAFLMFSIGFRIDTYIRTSNPGITDCSCMTFRCRFVVLADNPTLLFTHPLEVFKALTYKE